MKKLGMFLLDKISNATEEERKHFIMFILLFIVYLIGVNSSY